jgi:hypothetical protein
MKGKRYIDQEAILKATNDGYDVFAFYFQGVDLKDNKHRIKIRSSEKTASAHCRYFKGQWRITDFGDQNNVRDLTCIDFVKHQEGLVYLDALKYIEAVIIKHEVGASDYQKPKYSADYSWREVLPNDKKGVYNFVFKEKPLDTDLLAIGKYVNETHLDIFHCKVVDQYEFVGVSKSQNKDVVHIFKSTPDYPIFVFDYGKFKKLYKPHELEKKYRFMYIGDKPKDFIYGLDRLENMSPGESEFFNENTAMVETPEFKPDAKVKKLFRVSGESDALNLYSLGYHVYWLNSETAGFDDEVYRKADKYCEQHYQIMDLDATGREAARANALKHMNLFTLELPDWLKHKRDWRGNACKDVKDFVNTIDGDEDKARNMFDVLVNRAKPMKFWEKKTEEVKGEMKVNYNMNLEYYYHFMRMHGFYQMDSKYHKRADYCYARVDGRKVELIHPNDMKKMAKRFTKDWIKARNLKDEIQILNKINGSTQISENNLSDMDELKVNFKNYTKDYETLIFNNCAFKIWADKIERIKHEELENHVLGYLEVNNQVISHLIPRSCTLLRDPLVTVEPAGEYGKLMDAMKEAKTDGEREVLNVQMTNIPEWQRYELKVHDENFIFIRFLKDIAGIHWRKREERKEELTAQEKAEEDLCFINLMYIMGYMCSQYKDRGRPWMVFLQDMLISDIGKSNGRSGKSLFTRGMGFVRPLFYIEGRRQDIHQDQFLYDGFTRFHNIIEVDDLHEFANIDFFYTQITGKRRVNSKNLSPEILEYDDSGKMLVSLNFELRDTSSSTLARLLFGGVSDYYHERTKYNDYKETRSPLDKYGRRLFDDFTDEEWNKFYNFVAYCIQLHKRFGKINPPMENLEKRQLRRAMITGVSREEEFFTWANDYFKPKPDNVELTTEFSPTDAPYGYLNMLIFRDAAYETFVKTLADVHARKYTPQIFKKAVGSWCEYYGFTLNPRHVCTDKNRIIRTVDGKTRECFYISTLPQAELDNIVLSPEIEDKLPF